MDEECAPPNLDFALAPSISRNAAPTTSHRHACGSTALIKLRNDDCSSYTTRELVLFLSLPSSHPQLLWKRCPLLQHGRSTDTNQPGLKQMALPQPSLLPGLFSFQLSSARCPLQIALQSKMLSSLPLCRCKASETPLQALCAVPAWL